MAEPLTDEQIIEHGRYWSNRRFAEGASRFLIDFARAIERAHGIGVRPCGNCADGVPGGPDTTSEPTPCPECHHANGHYEGCGRGFVPSGPPADGVAGTFTDQSKEPR